MACLLLLPLGGFGAMAAGAAAGAVAVVVNPSVSVNDLSFAELRRIMLADRQFWSTGQPITVIVRAPVAEERTILLERVYRMSEARYREYWVAKVFRGEASDGPRVVLSSEEALDLVSVIQGAITAVDAGDVPGIRLLYAVNRSYVTPDHKLADRDEVVFVPPVS